MYAVEILDIQDDILYVDMYNELSKYKTLSHSEIDWDKVFKNSLELLTKSLDTRILRGFILSVISINNNNGFIKLNEVINHYHSIWADVYKKYAETNNKQAKIQNKFFIDPINELIDGNNIFKLNISPDIVENINNAVNDFNKILNTNFQLMVVPVKKKENVTEIVNKTSLSSPVKSIDSMDTREYRDYFFTLGRNILEKNIMNFTAYSLFWEGVWGRILSEVPSKNGVTEIRYPEQNTINIIKSINVYSCENISRSLSNLLLNPFWFEGYKIFVDCAVQANQQNIANYIKILARIQLHKFEWISKLHFSNNEPFCSNETFNFFNDIQAIQQVETVQEITKPTKRKKESLDTKSLKAKLSNINNDIDDSMKSKINGLIKLAEIMDLNGLDNNAHILYNEVVNIMETTLLKDYLSEEYININNILQEKHKDE